MSTDERADGRAAGPDASLDVAGEADGRTGRGRRRWPRVVAWVVAVAAWVVVCFTWLFPLLTELGLDPTLGG